MCDEPLPQGVGKVPIGGESAGLRNADAAVSGVGMAPEAIMAVPSAAGSLLRDDARCVIISDRPCYWPVDRRRPVRG